MGARQLPASAAEALVAPYIYDREESPGSMSSLDGAITIRETSDNLDQIERVLLDVAHETSPPAAIRERLDRQDVLFKIRLLQASLREREDGSEPQVF